MSFPKPSVAYADTCSASLSDLLASYRTSIDILRKVCHAEIEAHKLVERADPNFGDDIYLLRFVLSHHKKGVEKAKSFLLKSIEWRAKYTDLLLPIRRDLDAPANDDKIRPYMPGGLHYCTLDGHPLFIVRNGIANPHAVIAGVKTAEALSDWMVLTKESAHAYCDAKSRQLNKLIKVVSIQDFRGVSMRNFNRLFMNGLASSSHVAETVYPQLLKRSIIVNLPMLLRKMTALTMKLMPQGLQDKVGVCPESDPAKVAQYISAQFNIPVDDLPTFIGGKCMCEPHGCCNSTPNKLVTVITDADIKMLKFDSWASYVTNKLGQPPVSRLSGLVWPLAEFEVPFRLKGDVMGLYMTTLDAGFKPHPSLAGGSDANLPITAPAPLTSSSSTNEVDLNASGAANADAPNIEPVVSSEEEAACEALEAEAAILASEEPEGQP